MNLFLQRFRSLVPYQPLRVFVVVLLALVAFEILTGSISWLAGSRISCRTTACQAPAPAPSDGRPESTPPISNTDHLADSRLEVTPEPFPPNAHVVYLATVGSNQWTSSLFLQAPIEPGLYAVIKIEEWYTRTPIMRVYIHPASGVSMALPPGRYRIKMTRGRIWYGDQLLFGAEARFIQSGSPIDLNIKRDGSPGFQSIGLQSMLDGSSRSVVIRPDQF
jgi:hypothetical protein